MTHSLVELKAEVDAILSALLPEQSAIAQAIVNAMRHSVLGGGKRLRPMLAYASAHACGGNAQAALRAGCAVELIHAYSLIHDDLPAMDDDHLRHGLPSAHIAYGEANAILAGDSLHSLAFSTIATDETLDNATRIVMIRLLSEAAGWSGMAGGQCLDIDAEGRSLDLDELHALHAAKTGALIRVAVQFGALAAEGTTPDAGRYGALTHYGNHVGLAFQVMDDVLDVTQTTEKLGKPAHSDEALNKNTFPKLMGLHTAIEYAQELVKKAKSGLTKMDLAPEKTYLLAKLADLVVERDH